MNKRKSLSLYETLISLPIFDDPYVNMQAHNLGIVDTILTEMEGAVLRECFDSESTPASALVLSALSQLWIFGLYEILRTWRQRTSKVLIFGEEIKAFQMRDAQNTYQRRRMKFVRPVNFQARSSLSTLAPTNGSCPIQCSWILSRWQSTGSRDS